MKIRIGIEEKNEKNEMRERTDGGRTGFRAITAITLGLSACLNFIVFPYTPLDLEFTSYNSTILLIFLQNCFHIFLLTAKIFPDNNSSKRFPKTNDSFSWQFSL